MSFKTRGVFVSSGVGPTPRGLRGRGTQYVSVEQSVVLSPKLYSMGGSWVGVRGPCSDMTSFHSPFLSSVGRVTRNHRDGHWYRSRGVTPFTEVNPGSRIPVRGS